MDGEVAKKLAELQRLRAKLRAQVQEQLVLKQLELQKKKLQGQILALGGTIEETEEACGAKGNLRQVPRFSTETMASEASTSADRLIGLDDAKTHVEEFFVGSSIHGDSLTCRLACKLRQVEELFEVARLDEAASVRHGHQDASGDWRPAGGR